MREFLKIALNLFLISLASAAILGLVFMQTEKARKRNERTRMEQAMLTYVTPTPGAPAPAGVAFRSIHRYLVEGADGPVRSAIGYVLPAQTGPVVLLLTPEGALEKVAPITGDHDLEDEAERDRAVAQALGGKVRLTYTDSYAVAVKDGQRLASFIRGRTQGFKTWVHMLVALSPDNTVRGLDILEQEEDPGLGGDIGYEYFRNQFMGRTLEALEKLKVVKLPLPRDYRMCLERSRWPKLDVGADEIERMCQTHRDDDIYAITGATISSSRVTAGVKKLVHAFVTRMRAIDAVAAREGIALTF
jgi:electron transport complex protein RnfG